MSLINFAIVKNTYSYLYDYAVADKKTTIQTLEPLSVIINLAIISIKKNKTKIAVHNNQLFIQEPNAWQGVVRYAYGNNREEISFLLKPIMRALELYPPGKNDNVIYIYIRAIKGLKKLKKSYNNGNSTVCHSLDLYISIIENRLEGKNIQVHTYEDAKNFTELNLSIQTKINIEKIFNNIWDKNDIVLIESMLKSASKNDDNTKNYIRSIENVLASKETVIKERIIKAQNII